MGFIHKTLRNRLSTASLDNLIHVKTNMGVIYDSSHDSSNIIEEDEMISDDEYYIVVKD